MPRKILLADDSVTAQNMGRRILSEAGYEVVTVNNGSAALKKIAELKPDLVILDVYMPGYGGLEVCQRLKEGAETLAIPVLLTVGKLEPFRADEARRVHADAHLVKPFEATELLAALTKLEDKIVPRDEPVKGGKSASRGGSVSARGADFGDSVNGWKNRLGMPSAAAKSETSPVEEAKIEESKPEPVETPQASDTAFRQIEHPAGATEATPPAETAGSVASIYNGMVQDITADEIAAIAAAAAAFGRTPDGSEATPPLEADSEFGSGEGYTAFAVSEAHARPNTEEDEAAATQAFAEPEAVATDPNCAIENVADAEVVAALESLAPAFHKLANDHDAQRVALPEEVAVAAGSVAAGGPRWIAEDVPLTEAERTIVLEREMQKVYAALAEVEEYGEPANLPSPAASSEPSPGSDALSKELSDEPQFFVASLLAASQIKPEDSISDATAIENTAGYGEAPTGERPELAALSGAGSEERAAELESAPVNSTDETIAWRAAVAWSEEHPRAQADPVHAETEHEARAAEAEAAPEQAEPANVEVVASAQTQSHESGSENVVESTPLEASAAAEEVEASAAGVSGDLAAEFQPEAAYAATASVGGGGFRSIESLGGGSIEEASAAISVEAQVGQAVEPVSLSAAAVPAEPAAREADLAAAWAQWRQIRETIGGAKSPSPEASEEAGSGSNGVHAESSQAASEPAAEAAESSDPEAIANIVDSMLAELRPRLVQEIAKKLGKQQK